MPSKSDGTPPVEHVEEFIDKMRMMFKEVNKKKTTAHTPTASAERDNKMTELTNTIREDFKEVTTCVQQLIEKFEALKTQSEVAHVGVQAPKSKEELKVVHDVLIPKKLQGFLNTAEAERLGQLQRQICEIID